MKILAIKSNKLKTFLKSINLLDGQRTGEVIFRRFFFLVAMGMLIYILLITFVGEKEVLEEASAGEVVEEKVEWVEGSRVTTRSDGIIEVVPKEAFMSQEELDAIDEERIKVAKIEKYLREDRGNAPLSKSAEKFVEVANKYELDYRLLVAISVVESEGGKKLFRPYNAWGYGQYNFKNFNEGIEVVGKGLKTGYYDKGRITPVQIAPVYCPPNATHWARSVEQFMNEIEAVVL